MEVLESCLLSPSRSLPVALHLLVREGNNKAATKTLQDLYAALNQTEPKNPELFCKLARPFARLAGGDVALLTVTGMMSERAAQMKPDHAPYVSSGLKCRATSPSVYKIHAGVKCKPPKPSTSHHNLKFCMGLSSSFLSYP